MRNKLTTSQLQVVSAWWRWRSCGGCEVLLLKHSSGCTLQIGLAAFAATLAMFLFSSSPPFFAFASQISFSFLLTLPAHPNLWTCEGESYVRQLMTRVPRDACRNKQTEKKRDKSIIKDVLWRWPIGTVCRFVCEPSLTETDWQWMLGTITTNVRSSCRRRFLLVRHNDA